MDLGVVGLHGVGDLLEHGRLARLGRRHDHPPLTLADGGDQVDDAGRHVGGVARDLEAHLLVGEQRRQVLEAGPLARFVGSQPADRVDAQQRRVLLVAAGRPAGALDVVALAQGEAPHLADRHVDVPRARKEAGRAQEAEALVAQIQEALHGHRLTLELHLLALALALQVALAPVPVPAPAPAPPPVPGLARPALESSRPPLAPVAVAAPLLLRVAGRRRRGRRGSPGPAPVGCGRGGARSRVLPRAGGVRRSGGGVRARRGRGRIGRLRRLVGRVAVGDSSDLRHLGLGGTRPAPSSTGLGLRFTCRRSVVARLPHVHAGGAEDGVDEVGLLRPGPRLQAHGVGDGVKLVTLLVLENRALELLLTAHRSPRLLRDRNLIRRWLEEIVSIHPAGVRSGIHPARRTLSLTAPGTRRACLQGWGSRYDQLKDEIKHSPGDGFRGVGQIGTHCEALTNLGDAPPVASTRTSSG